MEGRGRGACAPAHRVRHRAAAVEERVHDSAVLGVVQEFVDARHLVEEDAAVAQGGRAARAGLELQICALAWQREELECGILLDLITVQEC